MGRNSPADGSDTIAQACRREGSVHVLLVVAEVPTVRRGRNRCVLHIVAGGGNVGAVCGTFHVRIFLSVLLVVFVVPTIYLPGTSLIILQLGKPSSDLWIN